MHELERKGVPAICKMHGIQPEELGVKGCLLIYRRREQDMPLAQPPENATPEQIAKTESVRQKMLRLAREKYLFRVQDRRVPGKPFTCTTPSNKKCDSAAAPMATAARFRLVMIHVRKPATAAQPRFPTRL
jgi:hypothetical protein